MPLSQQIDPTKVNVSFVPSDGSPALLVLYAGEPENVDEERAKDILTTGAFEIRVNLGLGKESAQYWTCDFSYVSADFLCEFDFASCADSLNRNMLKSMETIEASENTASRCCRVPAERPRDAHLMA